jgi:hypothetical protein
VAGSRLLLHLPPDGNQIKGPMFVSVQIVVKVPEVCGRFYGVRNEL